ncbi:hypothetical protein PoB_007594800 [Plakobranchus ocellatus]|uniref:Uncharacterized protein n=1 Tax=Plakobranchus ocellatus TaxID=259542 RepID=A0AAV4DYT5_9GAST|nr:hypothetical protein PoB_007594800 [Plakobranchus ocellatus]
MIWNNWVKGREVLNQGISEGKCLEKMLSREMRSPQYNVSGETSSGLLNSGANLNRVAKKSVRRANHVKDLLMFTTTLEDHVKNPKRAFQAAAGGGPCSETNKIGNELNGETNKMGTWSDNDRVLSHRLSKCTILHLASGQCLWKGV